eukprot:CAMPEP_0184652296 /NCGR_PEP_ID=MMETSP0308-20130426/9997_1 /TAXON_ID=38269 /ORGANISM="Gloeochaete witrockiana, Strain SAG 46.84" /LENGTH=447 /DNA_ID=CAMNT_0027087095 /DNA_START=169 /DNA_END=1512 /DNA_ORIENTATION=-
MRASTPPLTNRPYTKLILVFGHRLPPGLTLVACTFACLAILFVGRRLGRNEFCGGESFVGATAENFGGDIISHSRARPTALPAFRDAVKKYGQKMKVALENNPKALADSFIFWAAPAAGLGNRLLSFTSSFVLAVVLDRPFVVAWTGAPAGLLDLFTLVDPNLIILVEEFHAKTGFDPQITSDSNSQNGRPLITMTRDSPEQLYYSLGCSRSLKEALPPRLVMDVDQYFLPVLMHNPTYGKVLRSWFEPGRAFPVILDTLLRLPPGLQNKINIFRAQHFSPSSFVIGMHVRMREHKFMRAGQEKLFWQCAKVLASTMSGGRNVSFFLAADRDATKELAVAALGTDLAFVEYPFDRKSEAGMNAALMDIWLLGECNELVLSSSSTFGAIAAARTGVIPHVITTNDMCVGLIQSDPPFHFWSKIAPMVTCLDKDSINMHDMINQWLMKP